MLNSSVQLMQHQKEGVDFIVNNRYGALYWEVGCGKTLAVLAAFSEIKKVNPHFHLLVICPLSLIYGAWVREIEKFTSFKWHDLHGYELKDCTGPFDICSINFESLVSIKKFNELFSMLRDIPHWMCAVDESSRIKTHNNQTVRRLHILKMMFTHRVIMSGTPAPNIEWEYWPQMFFLSDKILGNNFYKFKNTYFQFRRGNQGLPSGIIMNAATIRKMHEQGYKYELDPKKKIELFNKMKPWCHLVKAKDCIDLPKEIDEYRMIDMTDPQRKIYKEMEKNYVAEIAEGQYTVATIILTKMMRLRQITSGFVTDDRGQEKPVSPANRKIEDLLSLVEECGHEQMIVWGNFHWELNTISAELSKIAGVSKFWGEIPLDQRDAGLEDFLSGKNRFFVANPHSAGHGLTLTNCHIAVFFSLDYSMEAYTQARGRIYRKGQTQNCVYFHILANKTIDEKVLAIVQGKETAQEFAKEYLSRKEKNEKE